MPNPQISKTISLGELAALVNAALNEQTKDTPVFVRSNLEESFERLIGFDIKQIGSNVPYTKGDPPDVFMDKKYRPLAESPIKYFMLKSEN